MLVADRGSVLLDAAYGEVRGVPPRPDSRFWIASIAKQFTSAAVLRCQEQGRLRADDPIGRFFPQAPGDKASITLRQLLTHASGLPQDYAADGIAERSVAVHRILAQGLAHAPGTRFAYSNDNYVLAAAALEIATNRRFEDYVEVELLRPAGLQHTGFAGTRAARRVAPTREPLPARLAGRQWGSVGAGGMFSTTGDLYTWYRALREGRVLHAASVAALFSSQVVTKEGASALGWFVTTREDQACVFTRGNDDFGANGLIYAYPERKAVVVILSHAGARDDDVSHSRAALSVVERQLLADS